ncbi:MAG TPA: NlpC/P60 family protein [Candidatus Acidoferrales bacterium]|nr:NlpC/P60 family protein [Candidatus Acidoferrales bacterium]
MPGLAVLALFAAAVPNAVVQQPVANMYSRPSEDADVVSQAIYGANVAVLEQKDGWAHIRTADEYLGWTPLPAMVLGPAYGSSGKVAEVQSLFAHIYREPNVTRHAPLITVPFEARLEVAGDVKDDARWLQVRLVDDRAGWVQTGDVSLAPKKMTIPEMLEFSRRFLGLPYTWGGTSSYGYDCSGFSQMLGRQRGLNMPRDAQPQADWSGVVPVDRKDLQPGDLLYFGSSEKKITHTGIYLGGGKFINATTYQTPMVRIDDLNEPHWTKLLVAARRVK